MVECFYQEHYRETKKDLLRRQAWMFQDIAAAGPKLEMDALIAADYQFYMVYPHPPRFGHSCEIDLGFDFVLSLKHLINICQIVGSLSYSLGVALRRVTFLQMCVFSKHAHLAHRQQVRTHPSNDL